MKRKLNNEELITFCSQMALILKSGISSLEGIYIMEDGDVSGDGREILKEIREEIEMCGMLYPAMKKSGVFPEYALHMTEIGEQTGRLDETMEALAAYYQREEEIFEAVKSAVTYPVAMLGMMLVIIIVLFIKVMPVFEQVYLQLGQEMTGGKKTSFCFIWFFLIFCTRTVTFLFCFSLIASHLPDGFSDPGTGMTDL